MSTKESYKNLYDVYLKESAVETKKMKGMREVIHKAVAKEASDNWRNHIPVYGWVTMNYPSSIKPSLLEKYQGEKNKTKNETFEVNEENTNNNIKPNPIDPSNSKNRKTVFIKDKHIDRLYPEQVNDFVMKEIENLIPVDHTKKFMKNYKASDLKFFKENFQNYEKTKNNVIIDPTVPYNYSVVKDIWSKSYLYELGYKKAFTFLTTDDHQSKINFIDLNLFFEKKYSTMFPKSNILGPEPDKKFSKKMKKIGDISFEEVNTENENVKNLHRLPPDNITEEWLKMNLNNNVEMIRLENCYWLSKDLLSKLGRMDENLIEISLRNLDVDNNILMNILKFAKNIEVLDISNCLMLSFGVCDIIKTNCKKLRSLKLSSLIMSVNDEGMESLANIETLKELDISLCCQISDQGLINYSNTAKTKNQLLTSLNLTGLFNITNEGIKAIINANCVSLTKLTISLLAQKNVDGAICSEISSCKKLIHIDISGCTNITNDSAYSMFSSNLENIESLNMGGININDSTVETLLSSNKNLKILRLSNSKDLSNNSLDYILNNPNNLLLLEINRTKKIDDDKIKETVAKRAPNLRIIRSCNTFWDIKNIGLKVPLISKDYVKPFFKGQKKQPAKKNDDKNPINQLKKLLEERKPKRPLDFKV